VIAGTKVLPQLLSDTRDLIASYWPATENEATVRREH
jgi:hypothetical protein